MDKTEPASEAKERIEKGAITYVIQETAYQVLPEHDHWKNAYIAGATAEHNRAQEEITRLKAELEKKNDDIFEACKVLEDEISQYRQSIFNQNIKLTNAQKEIDLLKENCKEEGGYAKFLEKEIIEWKAELERERELNINLTGCIQTLMLNPRFRSEFKNTSSVFEALLEKAKN